MQGKDSRVDTPPVRSHVVQGCIDGPNAFIVWLQVHTPDRRRLIATPQEMQRFLGAVRDVAQSASFLKHDLRFQPYSSGVIVMGHISLCSDFVAAVRTLVAQP